MDERLTITDGKTTIKIEASTDKQPCWFFISGEVDDGFGSFFPPREELVRLRDWLVANVKD